MQPVERRNRVWQMDFFELETTGGGTWRSGDVIDYWAKYVLAGPVTATQTGRDAVASLQIAISEAEAMLGRPLLDDLTDPDTGEVTSVIVVTDNGPCFKGDRFAKFIASRPELTHVRTRRRSPQTNGVIERYQDRAPLARAPRRRPTHGSPRRDVPPHLQRDPSPRDPRRRQAPRPIPHTPNAPNCADFLTRDTADEDDHRRHALCLQLVVNATLIWNARYQTAAIDQLHEEDADALTDQTPGDLSPTSHGHINPNGRYRFDSRNAPPQGTLRPLRQRPAGETRSGQPSLPIPANGDEH